MSRIFHICPLLILLCLYSNTKAQYFEVGGIAYNVLSATEHTVEVASKSCNYYHGSINIPATVTYNGTTYDVVALGDKAFYGGRISSVTIPSSVTQIKKRCFLFATGPSSVTVPTSVTEIGKMAFAAYGMTAINVAADNPNYVSVGGILFSKDTTTLVECPMGKNGTITLPQCTRHLAANAFAYCQNITGVTLPEGLESIGYWAFVVNQRLNNVVIPSSVTHIAPGPFVNCPALNNLSIAEGNMHYYMDGMMIYSVGGDSLVSCHKSADSVFLPNTLRYVNGFGGNSNVKYVHVPAGVTTIGNEAFNGSSLRSIDLPNQMLSIDEWAFYDCTSLTHVGMPATLGDLGEGCFEGCSALPSIDIPNGISTIPEEAFYFCESLSQITWGNAVAVIDSFAFGGCAFTEIQLPSTLRSVRMGAFEGYGNGRLRSVVFTAPVDTVEPEAFTMQSLGMLRFRNTVPPVTVTSPEYGEDYGCLYMADIDTIVIPCGSLNAWQDDSYWGQFADLYVEDCNMGIGDPNANAVNIYTLGDRIVVEGAEGETVRIFDITGRSVRNGGLSAGVYLVKIGDRPARKVVVMK